MKCRLITGVLITMMVAMAGSSHAKTCSRSVTAEMRANALANIEKFDWAKNRRDTAVSSAAPLMDISDDELWNMVPSQDLPRDIHTNKEDGCPNCGNGIFKYGNYPWKPAGEWKLKCPSCGEIYPKNDFWAYYQSGLDEHGFFHREIADGALLFNADHPDPKDPLHKLYVDDGYGMFDENGKKHRVIAYYNSWYHWPKIWSYLTIYADAYTLTSDPKYAHKAAVLLDRIADVYPDMDFMPLHKQGFEHSHGGSGRGRILGSIWEYGRAVAMARAYDVIYDGIQDDAELVAFCAEKAEAHDLGDKGTLDALCRHIDDGLLREIIQSCTDGRIDPNTGGIHVALIWAAVALDQPRETEKWLDYLFDPNFPGDYPHVKDPLQWILTDGIDRNGMGGECGGYGLGWTRRAIEFPDLLNMYPDYTGHNLVTEFPKLKQCFLIEPRLMCLNSVFPNIGDTGATGSWGRIGSVATFIQGYRLYKDPELAALAWRYAEENPANLRTTDDIWQADPDALAREIAAIAETVDPTLKCDHLGRYGQAYMQTARVDDGRAMWIHYGEGKGHSHHDCLSIGLYGKSVDMLPDLGYPEYTGGWPKRHAWTANTISHNTVLVDDAQSGYSPGGKLRMFVNAPQWRVMDAESKTAYPDIETYRRSVAMVDVSEADSYVVDVFRVRGGRIHRMSWHGPAETATVQGIAPVKQEGGTFAGTNVEFADLSGENAAFLRSSGFSYLYDIERTPGPVNDTYSADWKCEDLRGRIKPGKEPHFRLHALTPCDEIALGSGDPPQNKSGNPRRLRYLIQSRTGEALESQFVNVLEPYDGKPFIQSVRRLDVQHSAADSSIVAVAVELADGTTDIHINCEKPTSVRVEGGIEFDGQIAMIRLVNGKPIAMRMANATRLKVGQHEIAAEHAAYTGTVTGVNVTVAADNRVTLNPPLPQDDSLIGGTIHFDNALPMDTSYTIKGITPEGISTGDITVIRGLKDLADAAAGYTYLVNEGDTYFVPAVVCMDL